jgi:hypothetical protein
MSSVIRIDDVALKFHTNSNLDTRLSEDVSGGSCSAPLALRAMDEVAGNLHKACTEQQS